MRRSTEDQNDTREAHRESGHSNSGAVRSGSGSARGLQVLGRRPLRPQVIPRVVDGDVTKDGAATDGVGRRRSGPLFVSRQRRSDGRPPTFTRQRVGQIARRIAHGAEIGERIYPHLLRHTMGTRLPANGMDITDVQKLLGPEDVAAARTYAETGVAPLRSKFDQVTKRTGQEPVRLISEDQTEVVGAFAADLPAAPRLSI